MSPKTPANETFKSPIKVSKPFHSNTNTTTTKMHTPLSSLFRSSSAFAIRDARTPQESLRLFRTRLRDPLACSAAGGGLDPFDFHAAVFTVKSCSSHPPFVPPLHAHLLKSGLLSRIHVSTALLRAYSLSSIAHARRLFDEIPEPNTVTYNSMITCLSTHGDLPSARSLFDRMPRRDVISWSALIDGYIRAGKHASGLSLFRELVASGAFTPDASMLVTVMSACADTGSLRLMGRSIHGYAEKNFVGLDERLSTKVINMYTKSGCLRSAYLVFERVPRRNMVHLTAMICGLANHGHGKEAVELFEAMAGAGVDPNEITFTSVLNACCNAGMVEEGQEYFSRMVDVFGIEPSIHHYGCMVDLFAKAGMLEEAYRVVENMRVEPNIVVLTSLLAGCKTHRNFKVAEKVIERVLEMVIPDNDGGVYTLISNLYAMEGRWNDAERMRQLMDRHNVRKNRGATYIEMEEVRASAG